MYKREITTSLREVFLGHRTYHMTSWIHCVTFTWPPGVLLMINSYLRVAFGCSIGHTRCLYDSYTRASRSRVAFLTQSVNFVSLSCCPRVWFGSHRVAFRSDRDAFGWKLFSYAGVTLSRFWLAMDTRWRKFATSGMIVKTSGHSGLHHKPSCDRRLRFLGFGSNFGSVHKIFGMSKFAEGLPEGASSCGLRVSFLSTVWPSCGHPLGSCSHRLYFVWSSATPAFYSTDWHYDGHTVLADGLAMATRLRKAFA